MLQTQACGKRVRTFPLLWRLNVQLQRNLRLENVSRMPSDGVYACHGLVQAAAHVHAVSRCRSAAHLCVAHARQRRDQVDVYLRVLFDFL